MKSDDDTDRILVTKNFGQGVDDIMGRIELNKSTKAYEMLMKHPEKFSFEIGYIQNSTKPEEVVLVELSMVRKHDNN